MGKSQARRVCRTLSIVSMIWGEDGAEGKEIKLQNHLVQWWHGKKVLQNMVY